MTIKKTEKWPPKKVVVKKKTKAELDVIRAENGKKGAAASSAKICAENKIIRAEYASEAKATYKQKHPPYNADIAQIVIDCVKSSCKSLPTICKEHKDLPPHTTIYFWLAENPDFNSKYAVSKAMQATIFAEQIMQIADGEDDDNKCHSIENTQARDDLRVRTRQWYVGKLIPKVYGNALNNVVSDDASQEKLKEMRDRIDSLLDKHAKDY